MKATELMIGDWIRCDRKPYRIAEIGGMVCIDGERELFSNLEDIEPIPITGTILKRNGIKSEEYDDGFYWCDGDPRKGISQEVRLVQDDKGWLAYFYSPKVESDIEGLQLSYVHELQHALRLLGIDKEITTL